MAVKNMGGGSSAVAASSHAACARFRGTDPLITGMTRRKLARDIGHADDSGGIPEARWMRAMTFERLVKDERFASEVATTAVGRLGLARPTEVVTTNGRVNADRTADLLAQAHTRAGSGAATLIHALALPFVGFDETEATHVQPDFAVVAPRADASGSWLVMGDAKDYERVRSRVDDARLLKGFLQVALGAESAASWSRLPVGMSVHEYGVLAVPRNAFLQPEALVELLDDHRAEVRMRVAERRREAASQPYDGSQELAPFVRHLRASFDPSTCPTCTLHAYCRDELRHSSDPIDLLIELGIPEMARPHVVGLVNGTGELRNALTSVVAQVTASVEGVAQPTGQGRVDPAGLPGTLNLVLAKSDSAALGVHGIGLQRVTFDGCNDWTFTTFDVPQSSDTRRQIMHLLGRELTGAMKELRRANPDAPSPVHVVVPDNATADLLVSIADNMAGMELSRLRWERDAELGRPPLTFNGEPAAEPPPLRETQRTAVSFLLEEDRARALTLRSPVVDVRAVLSRHLVAGGPAVASLRLDYLTRWAKAGPAAPVNHRAIADEIEASESTPGARLTNRRSDAIHRALIGSGRGRRAPEDGPADPQGYAAQIHEELNYKAQVLESARHTLALLPDSKLRDVYRAIEGDAQAVWRRRLSLRASDLVRFGRTYRHWRNSLVPILESDDRCRRQLLALANPQAARDVAADAGSREIATAAVVSTAPLILDIDSRRIAHGSRIALLHVGDRACIEADGVGIAHLAGSFKIDGLAIGTLEDRTDGGTGLVWRPAQAPRVSVGDSLIVADFSWFGDLKGNRYLPVARPKPDSTSAPKPTCTTDSYVNNPEEHQYCCRPHELAEAEWSDKLADRRARGELNPQVWPPVIDGDAFEVSPVGAATADSAAPAAVPVPDHLTIDDLD
ncbi:hypothetical protein QOZ88_17285 [Blastococcus sp. BMG 814]|uniref:PD-(D/E)XK nuclease superfamily protein n=1 Tax=Blastococcus carthaginiensis TaxID=3050034 RepID=A0ABT9IFP4_9ACTN|nr:hypothetical protein [Blastococcus carthaginiensis]MDP5184391.1 hypothetical protein [Blastococcus carthaginiensis]